MIHPAGSVVAVATFAHPPRARGTVLIYSMVSMTVMLGMGSLAVDWGRVQMAKTEMQRAVDAAARAASVYLPGDTAGARAAAISIAAQNHVDGSPLVLLTSDVEFGKWNSSTGVFDTSSSSPDAVRITARRISVRGTAINLPMATALGRPSQDLTVQQITSYSGSLAGIIGLTSIWGDDNFVVASYDSAVMTAPTYASSGYDGLLGSNGNVRTRSNGEHWGNLSLGPSGSRTGLWVWGSTITESSPLAASASPAWNPSANPGGVSQTYSQSGTTTLAGGTYYFTSLAVNGDLTFSGAATLYVNGNVSFADNADLRAYNNIPANLKIYVIGTRTFGASNDGDIDIVADIHAPDTAFTFEDDLRFYGRLIAKTITVDDRAEFYNDITFGTSVGGSGTVTTVK